MVGGARQNKRGSGSSGGLHSGCGRLCGYVNMTTIGFATISFSVVLDFPEPVGKGDFPDALTSEEFADKWNSQNKCIEVGLPLTPFHPFTGCRRQRFINILPHFAEYYFICPLVKAKWNTILGVQTKVCFCQQLNVKGGKYLSCTNLSLVIVPVLKNGKIPVKMVK